MKTETYVDPFTDEKTMVPIPGQERSPNIANSVDEWFKRLFVVAAGMLVGAILAVFLGLLLNWIPIC